MVRLKDDSSSPEQECALDEYTPNHFMKDSAFGREALFITGDIRSSESRHAACSEVDIVREKLFETHPTACYHCIVVYADERFRFLHNLLASHRKRSWTEYCDVIVNCDNRLL